MKEAEIFVNILRNLIQEELNKRDTTVPCIIDSINTNGTVNIYLLTDINTIVPNIINASRYNFKSGDSAILYKIKNNLSNSFIIAKYNAQGE